MSKLLIRYNGNGFLHIKDLNITFKKNDEFELVSKTGLDIQKLLNNKSLNMHIGNSLQIIEMVDDSKINNSDILEENKKLSNKLDLLLNSLNKDVISEIVKDAIKDGQIFIPNNKINDSKEHEVKSVEDEEIRMNLLKSLVFKDREFSDSNMKDFGKIEKSIKNDESDGLEDIIDF